MNDLRMRQATIEEFDKWMAISKEKIIDDYMYIDDISYEKSLEIVKKQYVQLLPEGFKSKNQYFFSLDIKDTNIGFSWFGVYDTLPENTIFLSDIMIDKSYRSKGYGRKFLELTQEYFFDKDFKAILLHVTKRNFAKDLYKSLGYEVIQEGPKNYIMILKRNQ